MHEATRSQEGGAVGAQRPSGQNTDIGSRCNQGNRRPRALSALLPSSTCLFDRVSILSRRGQDGRTRCALLPRGTKVPAAKATPLVSNRRRLEAAVSPLATGSSNPRACWEPHFRRCFQSTLTEAALSTWVFDSRRRRPHSLMLGSPEHCMYRRAGLEK